ncbi:MAG TPA: phosphoribosyltransferase [Longimicrobiales bacterium]|nr:phosphoribosyltransferase [Longimicrobiales bacterium]
MPVSRTRHTEVQDDSALELTWEVFGELCRALAVKVAQSGYAPDLVVGIAKAGVIPGAVIASMLGCDFYSMKISRSTGAAKSRARPKIIQAAPRDAAGKNVLIVDELSTSGDTLRMATNSLRQVGPAEIRTAVSFIKVGGFRPDYYALEAQGTIIFPWDRHLVDPSGELMVNPMYKDMI